MGAAARGQRMSTVQGSTYYVRRVYVMYGAGRVCITVLCFYHSANTGLNLEFDTNNVSLIGSVNNLDKNGRTQIRK